MSKHTPGPWMAAARPSSVVGWPVVQTDIGRSICSVTYVQHSKLDPGVAGDRAFNSEAAANARLIAAAPDLLAACKEAADFIRDCDGGNPAEETGWASLEYLNAWMKIQDAITKAEPLTQSQR